MSKEHCLRIVDEEEELDGPMPDEVFEAIAKAVMKNDRILLAEQLRSIVRSTKQSIRARIENEVP